MKFKSKKTKAEFEYNPLKTNFIFGENGTGKTHFLKFLVGWLDARGPVRGFKRPDVYDFELLTDDKPRVQYFKLESYDGTYINIKDRMFKDEQVQAVLKDHYNIDLAKKGDFSKLSFGQKKLVAMIDDVIFISKSFMFDHSLPIVFLIDLPETGLSLKAQQYLMDDLIALAGDDTYFTVVTHSPEIVHDYEFKNKGKLIDFNN